VAPPAFEAPPVPGAPPAPGPDELHAWNPSNKTAREASEGISDFRRDWVVAPRLHSNVIVVQWHERWFSVRYGRFFDFTSHALLVQ
jgi:hypothetical protein